jgi:hypothetical protein
LSNYPSIFLEGFTTPDTYLMINDVWAPIWGQDLININEYHLIYGQIQ